MRRRVVVTGYGCVRALGVGVEPFWRALAAGRGGFRMVTPEFSEDGIERLAAGAPFDWRDHFEEGGIRPLDPNVQMALLPCREAGAPARVTFPPRPPRQA